MLSKYRLANISRYRLMDLLYYAIEASEAEALKKIILGHAKTTDYQIVAVENFTGAYDCVIWGYNWKTDYDWIVARTTILDLDEFVLWQLGHKAPEDYYRLDGQRKNPDIKDRHMELF